MRQKIFWAGCSLVILGLAACAEIPRPDADICVVNAPGKKLTCYNLKNDYNPDGQIKPGTQPHFRPAPDIEAVNKHIIQSPDDFVKLKAYVKLLREQYEKGCKN